MTASVKIELERFKAFTEEERDEIFSELLADAELREDLMDVAMALEAEAAGGEAVALDDYLAGKRTY